MSNNNTEFPGSKKSKTLNAARIEIAKGATHKQIHAWETLIVVLEGTCRFRLAGSVVTLNRDEVLRLPAYEAYSAEALADTIALKIANLPHHEGQQSGLPHDDPDQYLWGV